MNQQTHQQSIEVISFEEFLKRVPREDFDDKIYGYNALVYLAEQEDSESLYDRKSAVLINGSEQRLALAALFMQARHSFSWKVPISELYETLEMQSLMKFGNSVIVKLGSRRYAALDPDDFKQIWGNQGYAFICTAPFRLEIVELMPLTEKEAIERSKARQ